MPSQVLMESDSAFTNVNKTFLLMSSFGETNARQSISKICISFKGGGMLCGEQDAN